MDKDIFKGKDWKRLSELSKDNGDTDARPRYRIVQDLLTGQAEDLTFFSLHNQDTTPLIDEEVLFLTGADEVELHTSGRVTFYKKIKDRTYNHEGIPIREFIYQKTNL